MPKCPKCGAGIDHLKNETTEQQEYDLYVGDDGGPQYELQETAGSGDRQDSPFSCPVCGEELFHCEAAALAFLKGGAPVIETPMGPDPDEDAQEAETR